MAKKQTEPGFDSLMEKARRFCLFRERSRYETEQKIKSWGIPYSLVEKIMKALVDEKFINDARFAEMYARGKFNSNKWGKVKITAYLRQMNISQSDIRNALAEIPIEKYEDTALALAKKKAATLKKEEDAFSRKIKVTNYLLQKGFESTIVKKVTKYVK